MFDKMSQVFPESVCEALFHVVNGFFLVGEQRYAVFVCLSLNANELLLPNPLYRRRRSLWLSGNNQNICFFIIISAYCSFLSS